MTRTDSAVPRCCYARLLGISANETKVVTRGFRVGTPESQWRREKVGETFLDGYHRALRLGGSELLASELRRVDSENAGFAFEGAAMALALLDTLNVFRNDHLLTFLRGPGSSHAYMIHVGAGWAIGRIPWLRWNLDRNLRQFDPLLRWLAVDGYGFHEGYFHWPRLSSRAAMPRPVQGYAGRAFDQGVGRSLWFIEACEADRIPGVISGFHASRQQDLWSGVGLACAYTGGAAETDINRLVEAAGENAPAFAQGVAFAAKARARADNPVSHTELACRVACGLTASEAAVATDEALNGLPPDGTEPSYEIWRVRLQRMFSGSKEVAR